MHKAAWNKLKVEVEHFKYFTKTLSTIVNIPKIFVKLSSVQVLPHIEAVEAIADTFHRGIHKKWYAELSIIV